MASGERTKAPGLSKVLVGGLDASSHANGSEELGLSKLAFSSLGSQLRASQTPSVENTLQASQRRMEEQLEALLGMVKDLHQRAGLSILVSEGMMSSGGLESKADDGEKVAAKSMPQPGESSLPVQPPHSSRTSRKSAVCWQTSAMDDQNSHPANAGRVTTIFSMLDKEEQDSGVRRTRMQGVAVSPSHRTTAAGFIAPMLPLHWPAVVEPRGPQGARTSNMDFWTHEIQSHGAGQSFESDSAFHRRLQCAALQDPNSNFNVAQECLGVFILAYDLIAVPYLLAWDVTVDGPLLVFAYISLCFWTVDVFVSFLRGYYQDGELIADLALVAVRYLRTWFIIDASIVISEWAAVVLASDDTQSSGSLKILRLAKMGKMLRIISALRIFRLARIVESFVARTMSESVRMSLRVGALSFAFLWLNHMVSCGWFAIGRLAPTSTGKRWIYTTWGSPGEEVEFTEYPAAYQYMTSFHWAMAQTTLGSMEVLPTNSWERVANIICLMVGLLFGSTLVSSLSATMVEVQVRNRDRHQKMTSLRRYLNEHSVNRMLALKVQRQVAERLNQKTTLTQKDVPALEILSAALQSELRSEICRPYLMTHAMFRTWAHMDKHWFKKLGAAAVEMICGQVGDEIFTAGTEAEFTFQISLGTVHYHQESDSAPVDAPVTTVLEGSHWLCESALWSVWIHVGTVEVLKTCQVVTISVAKFWEQVGSHIVIGAIAREYSKAFHQRIISAIPPQAPWPSDVQVANTDQGDLVYSMSPEAQRHIGLTAIHAAHSHHGVHSLVGARQQPNFAKLEEEVMQDKSVVVMNAKGKPERVVSLIILSISRSSGELLYQVGSQSDAGTRKAKTQLPGVKMTRGELTTGAMSRLAQSKLPGVAEIISVQSVETLVEEKESKDLGVHTTYLRKVCHAFIEDDSQAQTIGVLCTMIGNEDSTEVSQEGVASNGHRSSRVSLRNGSNTNLGSVANPPPKRMLRKEVYFVPSTPKGPPHGAGDFYAWLTLEDAGALSNAAGEQGLLNLLQHHLEVPSNLMSPSASARSAGSGAGGAELGDEATKGESSGAESPPGTGDSAVLFPAPTPQSGAEDCAAEEELKELLLHKLTNQPQLMI